MPRFNFAHRPDADVESIMAGLRLIDPEVRLTGKSGTHKNHARGVYPVLEFIARKGIDDDVYMARLSPFWEGPEAATELLQPLDDVYKGPIGAQVRRLNRAWMGGNSNPGAALKDAIKEALDGNTGGKVASDPWNPDRSKRFQVVPKEQIEAWRATVAAEMEAAQKDAEAAADKVWIASDRTRLPRIWEPAFEAAAEGLSGRAREIFARLTCYHVKPGEILADYRDLDDGRMLVSIAPVDAPTWTDPLMEHLLEVVFHDEDNAGQYGKAVMAEPHEIDAYLHARHFVKGTLTDLLDRAEATLKADEAKA